MSEPSPAVIEVVEQGINLRLVVTAQLCTETGTAHLGARQRLAVLEETHHTVGKSVNIVGVVPIRENSGATELAAFFTSGTVQNFLSQCAGVRVPGLDPHLGNACIAFAVGKRVFQPFDCGINLVDLVTALDHGERHFAHLLRGHRFTLTLERQAGCVQEGVNSGRVVSDDLGPCY